MEVASTKPKAIVPAGIAIAAAAVWLLVVSCVDPAREALIRCEEAGDAYQKTLDQVEAAKVRHAEIVQTLEEIKGANKSIPELEAALAQARENRARLETLHSSILPPEHLWPLYEEANKNVLWAETVLGEARQQVQDEIREETAPARERLRELQRRAELDHELLKAAISQSNRLREPGTNPCSWQLTTR